MIRDVVHLTIKRVAHPVRSFLSWYAVQDEHGNMILEGCEKDGIKIQLGIKYGSRNFTLSDTDQERGIYGHDELERRANDPAWAAYR